MKKSLWFAACLLLCLSTTCYAQYPDRNIHGIIMWGAGGALDNVSRAITPLAAEDLGKAIVLQNKTGATGAIATTWVHNLPADGYTLLYGAENPGLYKVTGLSNIDYDAFDPVFLMMANVGVVIVPKDSPYHSIADLVQAAKDGKSLKMGSTGPGGLPYVETALMEKIHGIKFNQIKFDGEGPCVTALMGNHIDVVAVGGLACASFVQSGAVKALAVIAPERLQNYPEVPAIVENYPEYKKYLPWGAFFGVFVKKGTPQKVIDRLQQSYRKSYDSPQFVEFAEKMGGVRLGLKGEEARKYIDNNRAVSSWLLYDTGAAKFSPADFDISRP